MKLKLTIKHLAPYLPYGLKCVLIQDLREDFSNEDWHEDIEIFNKGVIWTYAGYCDKDLSLPLGEGEFEGMLIRREYTYTSVGNSAKPILRPLSDLTEEVEEDDKTYLDKLLQLSCFDTSVMSKEEKEKYIETLTEIEIGASYRDIQQLLEWHFDVFGLIEKGLAIDINTLEL